MDWFVAGAMLGRTSLPIVDAAPVPALLTVQTSREGFTDLTEALNTQIRAGGLPLGTATLVCLHTSCRGLFGFR
jgi:hypothetical protein